MRYNSDIQFVLIAYGESQSYVESAKYQILRSWSWYKHHSVCVVTDKPDLFLKFPVRVLALNSNQRKLWSVPSLVGADHFGIKIKALRWAIESSPCSRNLLLDVDMRWIRDPSMLRDLISRRSAIMYQDEGLIFNSKNQSNRRFEEALRGSKHQITSDGYAISQHSRMQGSAVIGLHREHLTILDESYDLFTALNPIVPAHTVEQFALSEALRLSKIHVFFAKKYTTHWSTSGKKMYADLVLSKFFANYCDKDFDQLVKLACGVRIDRPVRVLLKQKAKAWVGKSQF